MLTLCLSEARVVTTSLHTLGAGGASAPPEPAVRLRRGRPKVSLNQPTRALTPGGRHLPGRRAGVHCFRGPDSWPARASILPAPCQLRRRLGTQYRLSLWECYSRVPSRDQTAPQYPPHGPGGPRPHSGIEGRLFCGRSYSPDNLQSPRLLQTSRDQEVISREEKSGYHTT